MRPTTRSTRLFSDPRAIARRDPRCARLVLNEQEFWIKKQKHETVYEQINYLVRHAASKCDYNFSLAYAEITFDSGSKAVLPFRYCKAHEGIFEIQHLVFDIAICGGDWYTDA